MSWEKMTVEEYAALQQASGAKLVQRDGVWWRQVRPCFYQPLFPFQAFGPHTRRPPPLARAGGCQHVVPSPAAANSRLNLFVFTEPQAYSLDQVSSHRRQRIRRGLRHFDLQELGDPREFVRAAYPVYLSFYLRTHYHFKRERRYQHAFAQWAETLFACRKLFVLGAYREKALCAVFISYRVENVLMLATSFSHSDALHLEVSDAMYHLLRERAAAVPDLHCLFLGTVAGRKGVNDFKLNRGAVVLSKPAFVSMNPLCRFVLRRCLPGCYAKLLGGLRSPDFDGAIVVRDEPGLAPEASRPPARQLSGAVVGPERPSGPADRWMNG